MCVEYDPQFAFLVGKQGTVPDAHQVSRFLEYGILVVFGPGTLNRRGRGEADTIERTLIAVGRVGHEIGSIVLHDESTFIDPGPDFLPGLVYMDAFDHRFRLDLQEVFLQFSHPDVQAVIEPVEEQVRLSVVIDEQ